MDDINRSNFPQNQSYIKRKLNFCKERQLLIQEKLITRKVRDFIAMAMCVPCYTIKLNQKINFLSNDKIEAKPTQWE